MIVPSVHLLSSLELLANVSRDWTFVYEKSRFSIIYSANIECSSAFWLAAYLAFVLLGAVAACNTVKRQEHNNTVDYIDCLKEVREHHYHVLFHFLLMLTLE